MTQDPLHPEVEAAGSPRRATETVTLEEVSPPPETLSSGTLVEGRYLLLEVLGSGGFAVVYRALDQLRGHEVALKMLRTERLSDGGLSRFHREASLVQGLDHSALVRILDSGREGDNVFLTMELVRGESLAERLADGPPSLDEVVWIARRVLEALEALHAEGVVHRDVKPSNILLGPGDRVRLGDFGLARRWEEDATRATASNVVMGTVEYLSPEQALAEDVDARSDLYSLGVTVYEALAGQPPYRRRSSLGTLLARLEGQSPDVRELRPEVPAWLARILRRLLARRPEDRYPSATAVLQDLGRARRMRGFPGPRLHRALRKRGRLAAVLTILFLGLGGLGLVAGGSEADLVEVVERTDGLAGVGPGGQILWRRLGITGQLQRGVLRPEEGEVLVGVLRPPEHDWSLDESRVLSILAPDTGERLRTVMLPTGDRWFPDFSRRYSTDVHLVDLDDDGYDEVIVGFKHKPYWPSFLVLYEPMLARSRVALVSSGHVHFGAAADLDGDGSRELLLDGFNNRLGMSPVAAAVELQPPVNVPADGGRVRVARTPDAAHSGRADDPLFWYKLLPRRFMVLKGELGVDRRSRTLTWPITEGPSLHLDFDGFAVDAPRDLPGTQRRRLRKRAYRALREGRRLSATGYPAEALEKLGLATEHAERVGDPELSEHIRRIEGQALIAANRFDAADRLFRRILAATEVRAEVAFDAARSFHRAGALERAIHWYWTGLGSGGAELYGRGHYEFVEGIVFALEESGRLDDAAAALDRLERALLVDRNRGSMRHFGIFRGYLDWRLGRGVAEEELPRFDADDSAPDVFRYLELELRFAVGADPAELLDRVDRALDGSTETVPMLRSLRAALLVRLGRGRAAEEAVVRAAREVERPRDDEIYSRVFRDLVKRRHDAIVGATVDRAETTARSRATELRLARR